MAKFAANFKLKGVYIYGVMTEVGY